MSRPLRQPGERGDMFIVDVPTFAAVCAMGNPDAAAAYLVIAAGTRADNRTTSWSREAVNRRTALNWRKASNCFDTLEAGGFLRRIADTDGNRRRPRFDLPPIETRKPMGVVLAKIAGSIQQGRQPRTPAELSIALTGQADGWLTRNEDGGWEFAPQRRIVPAFLPKSIVGDNKGNPIEGGSIVERIRQARDPLALRLLVDLYHLQNMAEVGGVDRQWLWQEFDRGATSASTGATVVWTFKSKPTLAQVQLGPLAYHWRAPTEAEAAAGHNGARDFFERVEILEDAGALEWAVHLAEDGTKNATTIFPVAVVRRGRLVAEELESIIGAYATAAACAIGGYPNQAADWEAKAPASFIVPADRMARKATLVGIPRLRHRARTANVAVWRRDLCEIAKAQIPVFRGIIADKAPHLLAGLDARIADFNVDINGASKWLQGDLNDLGESGNPSPLLTERAAESGGWLSPEGESAGAESWSVAEPFAEAPPKFQRTGTEERF